jgi:hypothetical protein
MEIAGAADIDVSPKGERTGNSRINIGGDDFAGRKVGAVRIARLCQH